ncbi:SusD/RagB family nutrient-binding outer membrane lipoprotein [Ulvibacterium marinum]|uniref:SusD/RagB family nutrient-binding outer membrane lipoprotein n=1 Tax=Ulvibacterium marinum TaxID=2419782 RepID=A0A3B0CBY3_9FLAO|nr:SusD/RagB family nutrient-binding outer membrane lipoprotein [Ulvibacterium marinum]RKN83453.1 SusD/RagB family nutrient-binding outer membrane lipoprotein [Ulvibacterium marinum]
MKNIKRFTLVIFLIGLFSSCSEDTLTEIDTNPNVVNDAPLNSLLPQLIISYSNEIVGREGAIHAGFMSEQTSGVLGFNSYTDLERSSARGWENGYLMLNDLEFMKAKATENEAWTYAGIADILKAFTLTTLIDLYGDIPFSEALQSEIRNPVFEAHETLYPQIHEILDTAIENLGKSDSNPPAQDDLVFNGDQSLWTKTAYGLKARLYNKLSNLDATSSAQNALSAIGSSFASADENFSITIYNSSLENGNPYAVGQNGQPQSAVGNVYDVMLSFAPNAIIEEDPRSILWFSTIGGVRIPAPSGVADADFGEPRLDGAIYSKPLFLKSTAAPLPILTYNELLFIKAEANFRLGNTSEAYSAYQEAVQLALEESSDFSAEVQIEPADVSSYLGYPEVSPGEGGLTLETIISQKYIYLFKFQWIEAYNETRKFDFFPATNPEGRANRMLYPISEVTRNPNTPSDVNFSTLFGSSTKLVWAK